MSVSAAVALALASLIAPPGAPFSAPTFQSGAWEPWYGCWRAENAPAGESVCIVPADGGIRMVTLDQGALRGDSRVYADGQARQREQDGCTMLEWARWSADRERVFLTSELSCDGRVTRRSQGLLAFTSPGEWLSVHAITGEEGTAVRTVRFTPADGVRVPASVATFMPQRVRSSFAAVNEADVVEATEVLDPETVQEWLNATGAPFQVTDSYEGSVTSSALDDLDRLSYPVEHRTVNVVNVVHVLEPSWCIYGSCSWLRSRWCWDPWGYDRFAWRTVRPIIYVGRPVLVHVGIHFGLGPRLRIARYDGWGRNRWHYGYGDYWRAPSIGRGIARVIDGPNRYRGEGGPGYRDSRPGSATRIAGATSRGELPGAGGVRGTAVARGGGEPRATGTARGTAVAREEQVGLPNTGRAPATVRSGSGATGSARSSGSVIVRTNQGTTVGTSRGTAIVRGTLPNASSPRNGASGRSSEQLSTGSGGATVIRPGTSSGPEIIRGRSGAGVNRGPAVSRSGADSRSGSDSRVGTASGGSQSRPSIARTPASGRGSQPAPSEGRGTSIGRSSQGGPGPARGSAVARGTPAGSGSARGSSRQR